MPDSTSLAKHDFQPSLKYMCLEMYLLVSGSSDFGRFSASSNFYLK
jgi:hypothetical protein